MVREADSRTPSLAELGHLLVQVGIVSARQWATATAGGATDPLLCSTASRTSPPTG